MHYVISYFTYSFYCFWNNDLVFKFIFMLPIRNIFLIIIQINIFTTFKIKQLAANKWFSVNINMRNWHNRVLKKVGFQTSNDILIWEQLPILHITCLYLYGLQRNGITVICYCPLYIPPTHYICVVPAMDIK